MKDTTTPARWSPQGERVEQTWLVLITGITAISALAGAVGLLTGTLGLDRVTVSRFPWHSSMIAGFALVAVVAVPMAAAGLLAMRDDPRQGLVARVAGVLLIGWIAVELAVIREFSWLQVVFVVVGVVVLLVGRRRSARRRVRKGAT